MRSRVSAGLVLYRLGQRGLEVLLAHPGGPYFAHKDDGYWSIPKGQPDQEEALLRAAIREVEEEVGIKVGLEETFMALGSIRQKGGKIVHAWGVQMDQAKPDFSRAHTFETEWPPFSGRKRRFPEVDRAEFFPLAEAMRKVKDSQIPFLERLAGQLGLTADR